MDAPGTLTADRPALPRLEPLSIFEILDVAIKLCVTNAATLLKVALVVVVPVQLLATGVVVATGGAEFDVFSSSLPDDRTTAETNTYLAGQATSGLLQVIAVGLVTAGCSYVFAQAYLGRSSDWRDTLRFAGQRAGSILWIGLLYCGAFLAGFVAVAAVARLAGTAGAFAVPALIFFVLCVWFAVLWSVALPALMVQDVRGAVALRRSAELVRERWWPVFGVILCGVLAALVVTIVVQAVSALVIVAGVDRSSLEALLIVSLGGLVSLALTAPFQAALLAVVYFDLRVRKEGFQVDVLAERFGGEVALQAAGPPPRLPLAPPDPPRADDGARPYWPAPVGLRPPVAGRRPVADPGPPPPGWRPPG